MPAYPSQFPNTREMGEDAAVHLQVGTGPHAWAGVEGLQGPQRSREKRGPEPQTGESASLFCVTEMSIGSKVKIFI